MLKGKPMFWNDFAAKLLITCVLKCSQSFHCDALDACEVQAHLYYEVF